MFWMLRVVLMQGAGMTRIPELKLTQSSWKCFYAINIIKVNINLWKLTATETPLTQSWSQQNISPIIWSFMQCPNKLRVHASSLVLSQQWSRQRANPTTLFLSKTCGDVNPELFFPSALKVTLSKELIAFSAPTSVKPKNSGNTLIYWKHFFLSSLRIIFFL